MTDETTEQAEALAEDAAPDPAAALPTAAALVAAAQGAAQRVGVGRLNVAAFRRESGIAMSHVYRHFGSWTGLCKAAGLPATTWKRRVPEDEIFAAMRERFLAAGCITGRGAFEHGFAYSDNVISRRFGSWARALEAFAEWAQVNDPGFPLRAALAERIGARAAKREAGPPPSRCVPPWPARGGREHGPPRGFRAMLHAPVNEHGVVLLFGMVAGDLGYAIDAVGPAFPDCAAKRLVEGARWESVRVEFEYRSRSFREHGHDAEACDVVVCWRHDWPDCPLEVLELSSALAALR